MLIKRKSLRRKQLRRLASRFALAALLLAAFLPASFVAPSPLHGVRAADEGQLANQSLAEYKARRQKLLSQIKDGLVVLVGAREEDLGEVGKFRQYNDFMYLTGVETPGSYLILTSAGLWPDKPSHETLYIPPRNLRQERYTGVQLDAGSPAEQKYGLQEVVTTATFKERLTAILSAVPFKTAAATPAAKVYTIVPGGPSPLTFREKELVDLIKQVAPHVQVVNIAPQIAELRKVKSPAEIALLQKTIDITGEGQREAAFIISPGAYEFQVQGALEYAFTRNGSERVGFPSIVGSGIYSTILHYNDNKKRIESGDMIVVDIGAEYSYYTADITRTYPATGKFTERQRAVYQLVLDAQRAAEKAFKLGESSIASLNRVASDTMRASALRDKQGNTLDRYFIHGLGHWLGMDVHDVGSYGVIPVGAVFTIEPGIYIPEEKLGVRIEDDYLVTEKGLVKMSAKIPCEADEIEKLMQKKMKQ